MSVYLEGLSVFEIYF